MPVADAFRKLEAEIAQDNIPRRRCRKVDGTQPNSNSPVPPEQLACFLKDERVPGWSFDAHWVRMWQQERQKTTINGGTRLMVTIVISCILWIIHSAVSDLSYDVQNCGYSNSPSVLVVKRTLELSGGVAAITGTVLLWSKGSWSLYRGMVMAGYVVLVVTMFPPWVVPCKREAELFVISITKLECASTLENTRIDLLKHRCSIADDRHFATCSVWVLITSILLPFETHSKLNLVFILGVYTTASVIYYVFVDSDANVLVVSLLSRVGWLLVCHCVASSRKYWLEQHDRAKFFFCMQETGQTRAMFQVLADMVPRFVIVPLMTCHSDDVYAKPADCASILFIMLEGFQEKISSPDWPPQALLEFLNQVFASWDNICRRHRVMKVETVREEYVCSVGVDPEDEDLNRSGGHCENLARLINAAVDILSGQSRKVTVKMGLHTGEIFAGVIGQKLPRFRLFGDTINTAARMMQKGIPGKLQFSEQSHKHLPDSLPSCVTVEPRTGVYMKGKGEIDVYLLSLKPSRDPKTEMQAIRRTEYQVEEMPTCMPRASTALEYAIEVYATTSTLLGEGQRPPRRRTKEDSNIDELVELVLEGKRRKEARSDDEGMSQYFRTSFRNSQLESEWREWHLQCVFLNNICFTLNWHQVGILIMSIVDLCSYIYRFNIENVPFSNDGRYAFAAHLRLPVFLLCRTCAFFIVELWREILSGAEKAASGAAGGFKRVFFASNDAWYVSLQFRLIISYCFMVILFCISYDAISYVPVDWLDVATAKYGKDEKAALSSEISHYMEGQIQPPTYVNRFAVAFVVCILSHPWSFPFALGFILVSTALIFIVQTTLEASTISDSTEVVLFHFIPGLFALLHMSHESDRNSRDNFLAMKRLTEARRSLDSTLSRLAPPTIIHEMWEKPPGAPLPSHVYKAATVAQSDLTGFTKLASTRTPKEVVTLISNLFGRFDRLTDKRGVWKVETVGDAYIVAQAEPPLTDRNHALSVVVFSQDMIRAVLDWRDENELDDVTCRVGVHHGQCMGGVVGTTSQRYHLFGDLMSVLDLLESTSEPSRVQMSRACKLRVEREMVLMGPLEGELELVAFHERTKPALTTSKGEEFSYDMVGGRPFLVEYVDTIRPRDVGWIDRWGHGIAR